ncbi:hypothetical protein B4916_19555 [Yersinia intermedia]|nr:hypothetical protein B4916_19555 [Yersinia intermedia]
MTKVKVKQLTVLYLNRASPACDPAHTFQHCCTYLKKSPSKSLLTSKFEGFITAAAFTIES